MIYLLDADTLIRADSTYYALKRFPIFWQWLLFQGTNGNLRIPTEQYEEIVAGNGDLVEWLKSEETKEALLLAEEADPAIVLKITTEGYAHDLDETEVEKIGRDPFLIAYAYFNVANRCVVTFEVSAPSKQRANRKVPDVCATFGVPCVNLFRMMEALDFTTEWRPP